MFKIAINTQGFFFPNTISLMEKTEIRDKNFSFVFFSRRCLEFKVYTKYPNKKLLCNSALLIDYSKYTMLDFFFFLKFIILNNFKVQWY